MLNPYCHSVLTHNRRWFKTLFLIAAKISAQVMPRWSHIQSDPVLGGTVGDMEQYAAKLEAKRPNPGDVSMETSMMLSILSQGDNDVLEKLRLALLRSDLGTMVTTLEDANKHDPNDLKLLRDSYEEDDKIKISHALRRMTGDKQAGRDDDEFKDFDGKGYVRRDAAGQLERLPFLEEKMGAGCIYEIVNCWKPAKLHNSTYTVRPNLMPKEWKDTQAWTVMSNGQEFEWERTHAFSIIEANIANACGDFLTGVVDPNSGSMVLSHLDPTIPQDIVLNEVPMHLRK